MIRHIALVLLLAATGLAQDLARMDQVVQSYVTDKTFMGSVLVAGGDEALLSTGYGSANLEWNIANTPVTKFRLGSITKQFTAASILLLEERDKLSTDDPVKKFMPDAPTAWDGITVFHLLTHTSGIPNFTGFPEYRSQKLSAATPEQLVARFSDKPLDFQPGEKWSYSNSGYILLGYVLEKVSDQSYEKFLQENIFEPLGMEDSGYDSNSAVIPRRAAGYMRHKGGPKNASFVHMSVPFSAGALYSTTEDLLRWTQGLFGGKLLSAESLAKMTTAFKSEYALGVAVRTVKGRKVISHGGGIDGFTSFLSYNPEDKLTVVVLGNLAGPAPSQIAAHLVAIASGRESGTALGAEGDHSFTEGPRSVRGDLQTRAQGQHDDQARKRSTDQPSLGAGQGSPVRQIRDDVFFKVVEAEIEFGKDDKGAVTHLVLHQGGRDVKAPRTSDKVAERKEITVSPEILAQYIGVYEMRPGFDLVITLEGDQLISQATGQGKMPLFAEANTKFFPKLIDAEIEFFKDENGAVTLFDVAPGGARR